MSRAPVDVFEYLDYRAFLRDFYLAKKAERRGFSFRVFSRRAELRSPNYLKLVMDGARNLTRAMAERFARALGLEAEAAAYFVDLVAFNQARTVGERTATYQRITSSARYRQAHRLDLVHASYHASWFMPAIRELAARADFRDDPDWIAAALTPPITRTEARKAVAALLELGLLVRDADGRVHQGDQPLVSTGPETRGVHVASYHKAMMERAAAALDHLPSEQRDVSSLTMCVGAGGLGRLKDRIQRFRRELLELSTLEDEPAQVIQLNFQLFPLSRQPEEATDGSKPNRPRAPTTRDPAAAAG